MAVTPLSGVHVTPKALGTDKRPDGTIMEMVFTDDPGTGETFTMGTDTDYVNYAMFAYPVSHDTDATPAGISGLGKTVVLNGTDNKDHDVYIFGGQAGGARKFCLSGYGEGQEPGAIYWEIIKGTMSSNTLTVTSATDLEKIEEALFVLPVEIVEDVAPDTGGSGVTEIIPLSFSLEGGSTSEIAALVGGYFLDTAPASSATDLSDTVRNQAVYFKPIAERAPQDLICEIITKAMVDQGGDEWSEFEVTAADDCEVIRHIEAILPVCTVAGEYAIGWSGTVGATSKCFTAADKTDDVKLMVIGR